MFSLIANDPIVLVFVWALITAIATGLGVIPFLFTKRLSKNQVGWANAAAAGFMLAASLGMMSEGSEFGLNQLLLGMVIGVVFIALAEHFMHKHPDLTIGSIKGANAVKILLIIAVMTAHSFAEGIAIGVSFGNSQSFGQFISIAMSLQNIPEGLAICLVLIPKGIKRIKAAGWSIFSSLPQPLMAVPAFLFVQRFSEFLPIGLGFAASAMIWMVFAELLPDANKALKPFWSATWTMVAMIVMLAIQTVL